MKNNNSSITAYGVAFARAFETSKKESTRLFEDPFAKKLMGRFMYSFLYLVRGQIEKQMPGVFSFLVLRTRFIDDRVEQMVRDGVEQIVILGAGLDSRAYRMNHSNNKIEYFEVDHPVTQKDKKAKLITVLQKLPSNVTYVPVDFETETLTKLLQSGYDKNKKTLFIWEGVIYYLTIEAIEQTLNFVRYHSAKGSALIFDYIYKWALDWNNPNGLSKFQRGSEINGESFVFGFNENEVKEYLGRYGFSKVKDIDVETLKENYFRPKNREEKVASFYAIAEATT